MADVSSSSLDSSVHQARVMLWCTPQSTSTILTKCLSFAVSAEQSEVYLEPYTYCNHAVNILQVPAMHSDVDAWAGVSEEQLRVAAKVMSGETDESIQGRVDCDLLRVAHIKDLLDGPKPGKTLILCKEFAFSVMSVEGYHRYLPSRESNFKHVFLIRHPVKVFQSRRRTLYEDYIRLHKIRTSQQTGRHTPESATPTTVKSWQDFHLVADLPARFHPKGMMFQELHDLWEHVRKSNLDPEALVIDSDDLLSDPDGVLSKFCAHVGLPYKKSMLAWDESPAITDHWKCAFAPIRKFEFIRTYCHTALHSSHFRPPRDFPEESSLPEDVTECVKVSLPFYEKMFEATLK